MIKYVVVLISVSLALWSGSEWMNFWISEPGDDQDLVLSKEELSLYNGEKDSKGLYLAILGHVFNVEKGRKHYGPAGGYRVFAGRDASRAFVTGDFTDSGLTDDVSDLSPSQIVALYDWLAFYQKDYTAVGKVIGRFYSEGGKPTDVLLQTETSLAQGLKLKGQAEKENELYPACNSEWSADRGGRVWCSTKSGGVHRDWAGVPRMLFSPGSGHTRCVCVRLDDSGQSNNRNLQQYKGCPPQAESCPLNPD
ncbi:neuferricin precursor [Silurus asotus]|uniref:Neuferricin n=1 Tax=Silurus asotus TaxID=30991 RepID=A0AAD5AF22_SILAS|nr:neuferricin precursor [Silurus asotus]